MIEILPGIYQLQLSMESFPPGHTDDYLITGDDGNLLVDTGWDIPEALISLKEQLAQVSIGIKDISRIVLTHSHGDHAGLASRLKQISGAQIYLHKLEEEALKSRFSQVGNLFKEYFLQQIDQLLRIHGMPDSKLTGGDKLFPDTTLPPFPDITLQGDETIKVGDFNLKVFWTPGHTPGHISLYEPAKKLLFAGDLIPAAGTAHVGLHLQLSSNPFADYINSLNMLKPLEVNLILPGHGYPFTNLSLRIDEIVRQTKQKNAEILETIANSNPKTAYQISVEMAPPNMNKTESRKFYHWNKRSAVLEIIAYLESMRFSGEVDKFSRDDLIYYRVI